MNTLLTKTRKAKMKRRWNANDPRIIDVALGWISGELRTGQIAQVLEKRTSATGSTYSLLATGLKLAMKAGRIKIVQKRKS